MTFEQQRRRNRVTEWSHEQCPVAVDETLVIGGNPSNNFQVNGVQSMPLASASETEHLTRDSSNVGADIVSPTLLPTTPTTPTSFPTTLPSQSPSAGPTEASTKIGPHHFFPLDRRLEANNSFSKTQTLFFHRRAEEIVDEGNLQGVNSRFGHSSKPDWSNGNNDDYIMGLLSIAICVLTVVLGWLLFLAIAWTVRSTSRSTESSNKKKEQQQDKNEINDLQLQENGHTKDAIENQSAHDDAPLMRLDCESAASPRWLSFPDTGFALKAVTSFLTTDKSLASQDGCKEASSWRRNNKNNESIESQQNYYKIGVVRDGRVEVPSPNDSFASASLKEETSGLPWSEVVGNIFADVFGWEGNDSFDSYYSDDKQNQEDILRDLEELEHERSLQKNKNNVSVDISVELRDLQELESGIARVKLEQQLRENNDPTHISSLMTTAMQQAQQDHLLVEEGVEIWYDTQAKAFFKNDHAFDNNSYVQFEPSSVSSAKAGQSNDQDKKSRKWSLFGFFPWRGLGLGYKSLQLPSSDSVSDNNSEYRSQDANKALASTPKGQQDVQDTQPLYSRNQVLWMKFGRVVFFFAGMGIIVCSVSMATFGANTLAEASNKASIFAADSHALALEGSSLVDDFVGSSLAQTSDAILATTRNGNINIKVSKDNSNTSLFHIFDILTQQLYRSTNAYCDFGNQDVPVDEALNTIVDLWDWNILAPSEGNFQTDIDRDILTKIEGLQKDLSSVSDTTESLQKTWIQPFNVVVLVLRVGNCLLGVSCLLLLMGAWKHTLGHPKYKFFILPLYILLVVMSLVACVAFMMGSTSLRDVCGVNPDEQVLEFFSSFEPVPSNQPWSDNSQAEDKAWSALSSDLAKEYILQCPNGDMEGIPDTVEALAENGWEFSRALWEVSALLTNNGTCVNERIPALEDEFGRSPIVAMGELVMETSCNFSVLLTDLVDVMGCDNWYRLYEEVVHNAACTLGRSGFLWVTVTQSVIVALSLVMLTIRVFMGWPDKDLPNEQNDSHLRDKTMLVEDESDFHEGHSGEVENIFPPLNQQDPSEFYCEAAFDNDNPFVEEPHQMGIGNTQDFKDRTSGRILRKSPDLNKNKGNNYLSSTALYSIGGATFEAAHEYDVDSDDEDDFNIEVCLHPARVLSRLELDNSLKLAESKTRSNLKYSCATQWDDISDNSSFDKNYNAKVNREEKKKKKKSIWEKYKLVGEEEF